MTHELDHLRLTYGRRDDDGTGELTASASAHGWSGVSSGWVTDRDLHGFADAVRRFPLSDEAPPRLVTGYGLGADEPRTIDIDVAAVGGLGQLVATVDLAAMIWPDDPVPVAASARIVLPTSYQRLAELGAAVEALVEGHVGEAVLLGELFRR